MSDRPGAGTDFILQFQDDAFSRLLADTGHLGQALDVLLMDGQAETVGRAGAEDAQGHFGSDAIDADEKHEQIVFILRGKAIQDDGVFADAHISIEHGFLADTERVQRRSRCIGPVADAVDVDETGIDEDVADHAFQITDHNCTFLFRLIE